MRHCNNGCGMSLEFASDDVVTCYMCRKWQAEGMSARSTMVAAAPDGWRVGQRVKNVKRGGSRYGKNGKVVKVSDVIWVQYDGSSKPTDYKPASADEYLSRI